MPDFRQYLEVRKFASGFHRWRHSPESGGRYPLSFRSYDDYSQFVMVDERLIPRDAQPNAAQASLDDEEGL